MTEQEPVIITIAKTYLSETLTEWRLYTDEGQIGPLALKKCTTDEQKLDMMAFEKYLSLEKAKERANEIKLAYTKEGRNAEIIEK